MEMEFEHKTEPSVSRESPQSTSGRVVTRDGFVFAALGGCRREHVKMTPDEAELFGRALLLEARKAQASRDGGTLDHDRDATAPEEWSLWSVGHLIFAETAQQAIENAMADFSAPRAQVEYTAERIDDLLGMKRWSVRWRTKKCTSATPPPAPERTEGHSK